MKPVPNSVLESRHEVAELLTRHEITPTSQRIQIARTLLARYQHLSADQILNMVNGAGQHMVSKATVYNTLNLFARKGLVREVIVNSSKVFYDSNINPHYHIYNEDTGELMDLEEDKLRLTGDPELPENTVKTGIDVVIRVHSR